ncbi:hypothetical protein [Biostraticola tofi]|uniref:Uncharacterized protein n=1 Tax=Biostraticola tofi TaxID=466109 RepID=A0A4R3Z1W7_9GAMM|nr:hypothetical protein [Biostraticola tofi]TCV98228.1 hypothetical protein EDC52_103319 [Biostraticola tofi]
MRSDLTFIMKKLGVFAIYGLVLSLLFSLLFIDAIVLNDIVKESSLTEVAQELLLLAIILLHLSLCRDSASRYASSLVAGFFACMLIREMDFAFDAISHGSWVWAALAVTLVSVIYAGTSPSKTVRGVAALFRHPSYGLLLAGLLNVLVFSRLFGMGDLWRAVLDDGYIRTVKNVAEEGSELFGYGLCLLATLSYVIDRRKLNRLAADNVKQRSQPHAQG